MTEATPAAGPAASPAVSAAAVPVIRQGAVRHFDQRRAVGSISETGGGSWFFHCSAIADGPCQIDVGAPVAFALVPGRLGQWEAGAVVKLAPPDLSAG